MSEMTPEKLRELIGCYDDNEGSDAVQADMRDCASAWEANLHAASEMAIERQDLLARIEDLERVLEHANHYFQFWKFNSFDEDKENVKRIGKLIHTTLAVKEKS